MYKKMEKIKPFKKTLEGNRVIQRITTMNQMSCHAWALNGNRITAQQTNIDYTELCSDIGNQYDNGSNLHGKPLSTIRNETMQTVALLSRPRTVDTDDEVWLCGAFNGNDVTPSHLWLENRTTNWTYDTMPGRGIISVDRVGVNGHAFQPGCEAFPIAANNIARVRVDGFTRDQHNSI